MRLPLDRARHVALFELLDDLERLGTRAVLVGGLVPPLLLERLDPEGFASAPGARSTADCDLVLHVPLHGGTAIYDEVQTGLRARWSADRRVNQFRWNHHSGLRLDLIPVPVGIERGDPAAIALASRWSPDIDVEAFYRAQEFAIATALDVEVVDPAGLYCGLRIAGLVAMLAMKLQAWNDSYRQRRRDAHDVAWLLRYLGTTIAVAAMRDARAQRPDLVDNVGAQLRRDFADAWGEGVRHYVAEAFPDRYRRPDDEAEGDRNAAAMAIRQFLDALEA